MYYFVAYIIFLHHIEYSTEAYLVPEVSPKNLYDGAQVWRTYMRNLADINVVKKLVASHDLSLWLLSPQEAVFLVQPERKVKVHRVLSGQGLNHTVVIMDVQRRIDEHGIGKTTWDDNALRRGHRMNWKQYPNIEVINEYLEYLGKQYESVCNVTVIGHSVEKRAIKMVTVSNGNPSNKRIMVVGGVHAREWVGITSALFILREIVTKFDEQPKFVQNLDWFILPLANPDGYHFTYTGDRLWRKNRRKSNNNTKCIGIDLNRNFGSSFGVKDISNFDPCGETFGGERAFSEPETVSIRDAIIKATSRLVALVDLHAYGQIILYPWCSKPEPTPDAKLHNETSSKMVKAIYEFKRRTYTYGPTYHAIYAASGAMIDWAYALGVRHAYCAEGRDRLDFGHGFLMPPAHIQEAGQEMLVAVKRLAKVLEETSEKKALKTHRWF